MSFLAPVISALFLATGTLAWAGGQARPTAVDSSQRPQAPVAPQPPEERWDLELQAPEVQGDLRELVAHLERRITGPDVAPVSGREIRPENIPSVDRFLKDLELELSRGSDSPRERVLRNAERGREVLRWSYNHLAQAQPLIAGAKDAIKAASLKLPGLLARNKDSVRILGTVADSAQATAGAMRLSPPGSEGAPVPVEQLCGIMPLEPELRPIQARLKKAQKDLQQAKKLVEEAEEHGEDVDKVADGAGDIYTGIMARLNERRATGEKTKYYSSTQSREVITTANEALARAAGRAERAINLMAAQLDPMQEGVMRAAALALEADGKTQDGKTLGVQHGARINYNHEVRMKDPKGLIPSGWKAALPRRKPWWVGRARLAKGESSADARAMARGHEEAAERAEAAEQGLAASLRGVAETAELVGPAGTEPRSIARRPLRSKPAQPLPDAAPREPAPESRAVRNPRAMGLGIEELQRAFDGARQ